jgi:hypothetical protein
VKKGARLFQIAIVVAVVAVTTIVTMNIAISTPATPSWEVWVVDQNGRPLPGMTVRMTWANYSVENTDHEEDCTTDEKGYAAFPARMLKSSITGRIIGTMRSASGFPHSSFGPHAHVFAFGHGLEGDSISGKYITDWTGSPSQMQSRIIAKPSR